MIGADRARFHGDGFVLVLSACDASKLTKPGSQPCEVRFSKSSEHHYIIVRACGFHELWEVEVGGDEGDGLLDGVPVTAEAGKPLNF